MKIVNVIPHAMSEESHQDSCPNIAVNPHNPNEIVISTVTPDPNGGANSPVFVSTDGGNSWTVKSILPGGPAGVTLKFGKAGDRLYAAEAPGPEFGPLEVLRITGLTAGAAVATIDSEQAGIQQPYVAATTVAAGPDAGKDRLYVGMNVLQTDIFGGSGQTSTIRQSMQADAAAPVFSSVSLDRRPKSSPAFQDLQPPRNGPQVRPAVHSDGTVYAVFYSWKSWADPGDGNGLVNSDVVIVRDDNWGQSADPYGSLLDSADGYAGQRIAIDVPLQFYSSLGQERTGGELSVAVDPTNSSVVYVAWAELADDAGGGETDIYYVHLRRSTDRGQTWSASDVMTVSNGKNPSIAINSKGQVGFLYQQLVDKGSGQRWETHLAFSQNAIQWKDLLLATVPAGKPAAQFLPYIGDYADMMAVGETFYGVFCANNTPSLKNFPYGVTYHRNANFTTGTLSGLNGATPVPVSIDPFFFKTPFVAPSVRLPAQNVLGSIIMILFGIIGDGGGAYIDGQGHIHIIGPGDPGPVWEYLVSLAEYKLAESVSGRAGLEMQRLALQNVVDMANQQIARLNGQIG